MSAIKVVDYNTARSGQFEARTVLFRLLFHALRAPTDHYGNLGISPSVTRQTHGVISGLASIISAMARS